MIVNVCDCLAAVADINDDGEIFREEVGSLVQTIRRQAAKMIFEA